MMAILIPHNSYNMTTSKHIRRTATTVMAGAFDSHHGRDVLTSLLNGIGPYRVVEKDEETRRNKKREKKERDRERKRAKAAARALEKPDATSSTIPDVPFTFSNPLHMPQPVSATASSFWRARPAIHIATMQRSVSVTPPPLLSSSPPLASPSTSTPGPSNSGSTSRTSSKRPHTPNDFDDIDVQGSGMSSPVVVRKKRIAVKKGWKGWVEGSPPPSEKLINLDAVPPLRERRTRSGKNFDAIGVGKDGWV